MIYIENKKKKEKTILAKYTNAIIVDVTSKAPTALVKLSPFYPHGEIPIPFSENQTAKSVEGIWQALKVFEDADIDNAVIGAMFAKYRNAGQACVAANRFYVHKKVHDEFVEKFAIASKAIKVGSGLEPGVTQGPLIDEQALAKVQRHITDALAKGAKLVTGGKSSERGGTFFEPTILANASNSMLVACEETFGPVAPVIPFESDEEVVKLANHSQFGLASYFYSRDIGRIWKVAEALEFGMVGVNTGMFSNEVGPFGGVKQSGLGREGSSWGIDEYLEMKYVCVGL